jgi:hypothetical protein
MKTFALDEGEHRWRGFLHDKDCCSEIVQKFLLGIRTDQERDLDTVFEAGSSSVRCQKSRVARSGRCIDRTAVAKGSSSCMYPMRQTRELLGEVLSEVPYLKNFLLLSRSACP